MRSYGVKVIIGPATYNDFDLVKKYNDLIFISPSNISPKFSNNIISIGVSLESQLIALTNFLKKQKKTKTIIMYPKNEYFELIKEKIQNLDIKNFLPKGSKLVDSTSVDALVIFTGEHTKL